VLKIKYFNNKSSILCLNIDKKNVIRVKKVIGIDLLWTKLESCRARKKHEGHKKNFSQKKKYSW
jgi:hypothetical protein